MLKYVYYTYSCIFKNWYSTQGDTRNVKTLQKHLMSFYLNMHLLTAEGKIFSLAMIKINDCLNPNNEKDEE